MGGFGSGRRARRGVAVRASDLNIPISEKQAEGLDILFNGRNGVKPLHLGYGGAARAGKSKFSQLALLRCALVMFPGEKFVVCRRDLKDLIPQFWSELEGMIKALIPPRYVLRCTRGGAQGPPTIEVLVQDRNGNPCVSTILAFSTKNPDDIMGHAVRFFFIEESHEVPKRFTELMASRFSHLEWQPPHHAFVHTFNPHPGWLKKRFVENPDPYHVFVKATIFDNPFINREEAIEEMLKGFIGNDSDLQRYLFGDWNTFAGRVYPQFNEDDHVHDFDLEGNWVIWRPFLRGENGDFIRDSAGDRVRGKEQKRRIVAHCQGMDHGYKNPSAIVWAAVDEEGDIWAYDEYYEAERLPDYIATSYHETSQNWELPQRERRCAGDYSMKKKHQNYRTGATDTLSVWEELLARGMPLITAEKSHSGISNIQGWLARKKIHVHPDLVFLIREFYEYSFDESRGSFATRRNTPEEVRKKDDHAMDAFRYLFDLARRLMKGREKPEFNPANHEHVMQATLAAAGLRKAEDLELRLPWLEREESAEWTEEAESW